MLFIDQAEIAKILRKTHNLLRNKEGLQPTEAFDSLANYIGARLEAGKKEVTFEDLKGYEEKYQLPAKCTKQSFEVIAESFADIPMSHGDFDFLSAGLRQFINGSARKSLGIFLTPEVICDLTVETAAKLLGKKENIKICDPACGAGTFLLSANKTFQNHCEIFGYDISDRMALLARLNTASFHNVSIVKSDGLNAEILNKDQSKFDLIVTNPPFGSEIQKADNETFGSLYDATQRSKIPTELAFIFRCLELLTDDGILAIVLQKGVFTNVNNLFSNARKEFSSHSNVLGVFELPPETFYATGTQSNTVVAFIARNINTGQSRIATWRKKVSSIGIDGTGRTVEHNEAREIIKNESFSLSDFAQISDELNGWNALKPRPSSAKGKNIGALCELVKTGRTPARSKYADSGIFIVKVGNLTGKGINFEARDRNFINAGEFDARNRAGLMLKAGDILLTSSAHAPKYIAKKVDIFDPPYEGVKEATFVGEIMLIRPKQGVDPYRLLFLFRMNLIQHHLQESVIGQTAHLSPQTILDLKIDETFFDDNDDINEAISLLKQESIENKKQFDRSNKLYELTEKFQNLL